jgi:hypothetical protein
MLLVKFRISYRVHVLFPNAKTKEIENLIFFVKTRMVRWITHPIELRVKEFKVLTS